jgi:hypothetical protein
MMSSLIICFTLVFVFPTPADFGAMLVSVGLALVGFCSNM